MKTYILETFEDEMTGELGLGVLGLPRDETTNATREGLLIAHDLIEHVNGLEYIGTIDDELEALGAIWYVRGQWGELRRDGVGSIYSTYQNIASDITRMFRDHVHGGQYVGNNARWTRPVTHDTDLQDILAEADKTYLDEFDDDSKSEARSRWLAYRLNALHRMRIGYSKARRKYERRGRFFANNLFWAIAAAVDRVAKHCDFEGQRYTLRVNSRDCEAMCEEGY